MEFPVNLMAAFGIFNHKMNFNKWNPIVISNSYDSVYARVLFFVHTRVRLLIEIALGISGDGKFGCILKNLKGLKF